MRLIPKERSVETESVFDIHAQYLSQQIITRNPSIPNARRQSINLQPLNRRSLPSFDNGMLSAASTIRTSCFRPPLEFDKPRRHYYGEDGKWYTGNPNSARESRYSDFVLCDYDERSILTRILQSFKDARSFLASTNGTTLLSKPFCNSKVGRSGSTLCDTDNIEMIASSHSPTLHGSNASSSPSSCNASYRSSRFSNSPRSQIKPPPPAAFPRHVIPSPKPLKRPLPTSSTSSPKVMKDAGTQYTPPSIDPPLSGSVSSLGKRRGTSQSPKKTKTRTPPPEPTLEPKNATLSTTGTNNQTAPIAPTASASTIQHTTITPSNTFTKSSSSSSHSHSRSQESSPKRHRAARPSTKAVPHKYETCDTKDLVILISDMLMELIRHNDDLPLEDGRLTRFHSRAPPGISVKDYLQRLTTHATLSPPILLSMVYYIDRLCALYPTFNISSLTVHRFLIASATVASKGLSDSFWTNNTYARVGGVSLKELALLELEFLWRVEWKIVPKPEVLVDYYYSLVERSEVFKMEGGTRRRSRGSSKGSQFSGSGGKGSRDGSKDSVGEGKGKATAASSSSSSSMS